MTSHAFGIRYTPEGALIYGAMLAYLLAAVAHIVRQKLLGWLAFGVGFATITACFAARWLSVSPGHIPMQSMYEIFICLGMVALPISLFCRFVLKVGGVAGDCIAGFIVLFPAGFVFAAEPQRLPPALQSAFFIPHVAAYMLSYMIMAKAAVQAGAQLLHKTFSDESGLVSPEQGAHKMVRLGFPLLTVGLALGSLWAKLYFGDYWQWDPKELWSLASWLVFLIYLHLRSATGRRYPRAGSWLVLGGTAAIVITLLWVNLGKFFKGWHSYAS